MPSDPAATRHALILASGPFGHAVADRLREATDLPGVQHVTVQHIDSGTHPSLWPRADVLVLALSHERPAIAQAADRSAFAWGMPWIEACLEPTDLRVGPVVVPGRTACYQCFLNRRRQHQRTHLAPASGKHPSGFGAHHAGIAAALTRQAIGEALGAPDPDRLGGTVRRFNLVTGATNRSGVLAVDRCPRCRERATSEHLWQRLAAWKESM